MTNLFASETAIHSLVKTEISGTDKDVILVSYRDNDFFIGLIMVEQDYLFCTSGRAERMQTSIQDNLVDALNWLVRVNLTIEMQVDKTLFY